MMKVAVLCLVILMAINETSAKLLLIENPKFVSESFDISRATVQLIEKFYLSKSNKVRFMTAGNDTIDTTDKIRQNYNKTSFSVDIENLKKVQRKFPIVVIIFINLVESFKNEFLKFRTEAFNRQGFITIVAIKHLKIDEISNIFELFWKTLLINVNLITPSVNGTLELFTFIPYNNLKCGDTMPVKINIFTNNSWQTEKFHREKIKNLYKCPINVAAAAVAGEPYVIETTDPNGNYEIVGVEMDMFEVFAKALNFELKIKNFGKLTGHLFENGSATGEKS